MTRTPTQKDRENLQLLFGNYLSKNRDNLLDRLKELKWKPETIEKLEELGFIFKPDWVKKASQVHYERLIF